jgi:ATP-dependent Clp protease protease subunit
MRPVNLLNLLRNNAKRGEFRAEGNVIWLYDAIVPNDDYAEWFGGVSAQAFIQALNAMSGKVSVRINCPGGEVFSALAMAQAMREYPGEITCHVDGLAASAASYIAIAGAKTIMAPGSFVMIHEASTFVGGNKGDLTQMAARLELTDGSIAGLYADKTDKATVEEFLAMMEAETWFTAEGAVEIGLATEVSAARQGGLSNKSLTNTWDLSEYAKAPTIEAPPAPEPVIAPEPVVENQTDPTADQAAERERRIRRSAARLLSIPA